MIKFLILILLHTVRKIGMYGVLHILSYSLLKTLKSKSLEVSNTKFTENLTVSYLEMIYFYSFPWGKFACTIYNDLKKNFFFCQGLLSRTLATDRTAGDRKRLCFIPLYHFHPLTNIKTFIYNFACEMTITYL